MTKPLKAIYNEPIIPEFSNNPVIECLPDLIGLEEFYQKVIQKPKIEKNDRTRSSLVREFMIERLDLIVYPNEMYFSLYKCIVKLISFGYISRNPLKPEFTKKLYDIAQGIEVNNVKTTASTALLTGLSGMGKTTMMNSVLSLIPQVYAHKKYQSKRMNLLQVVWLKVDCPADGSRGGFCHAFFLSLDKALDNDLEFTNKYSKLSVAKMAVQIEVLCMQYFIGIIVIDEFQNMSVSKSGGKEMLLNFFNRLVNMVSVPIFYIGTSKVISVFPNEFRSARRTASAQFFELSQPKFSDSEFQNFIEAIWNVQWLQKPKKITDELINVICEITQGITSVVVELLKKSQLRALAKGQEYIDISLMKETYQKDMKPLHRVLRALRVKDTKTYEDLICMSESIDHDLKSEKRPDDLLRNLAKEYLLNEGSESSDEDLLIEDPIEWEELDVDHLLRHDELLNIDENSESKLHRTLLDMKMTIDKSDCTDAIYSNELKC